MAFENMKEKEAWHKKGARVRKDNTMGILTQFAESKIEEKTFVHTLYVLLDGCTKAWPYNPNDITEA